MKQRHVICLALALILPASIHAQAADAGRITGKVTVAEGGAPIAGAQVLIPGTRIGTLTHEDGSFTLNVRAGTHSVRATMLGFAPVVVGGVTVAVGEIGTVNFQMTRKAILLDEVVTTGYGSQRRGDVTGSVASVGTEQISQMASSFNVIEAIKGRVPGVDIISTGYKPGDGIRVRIRGQRSLKASNDPLYVLDGIPMAGGIGDLNSTDIESLEVLKDASATAIYGARGANGVVLITTRRGRAGRTRVTYDTYAATQSEHRRVRMFNAQEFAQYRREAARTSNEYNCAATELQCDAGDADLFFAEELECLQIGCDTDWQNLILKKGMQASHQLSVAGGNERTQYSVSANMLRHDGVVKAMDFERKSMRTSFETQASDRVRFGASALVLRSLENIGRGDAVYGEALRSNPLSQAFDAQGNIIFKPTPDGQVVNPLSDIANHIEETQRTRAFGTLFSDVKLTESLNWRVNFGPDITFERNGRFRGAETQAKQGAGSDGRILEDRRLDYTLDNILTYKRALGSHRLDATFLYGIEEQSFEQHDATVSGLPYEHQRWYNIGSATNIESVSSELEEWQLQSYMARVNYSLNNRYLLTVTTRVDGSSRLAPGHKYAVFPSIALGWQVGDEAFMSRFPAITSMKLRASYGRAGNTAVDPYSTEGSLSRTVYSFGDQAAYGFRPGSLPNPNLEWEKTDQVDVGLEFGLLRDRLTGTLDVYRAYTHDLLMDRQLPPNTGYSSITYNVGETQNTGLEVGLSAVPVQNWRGLRWSTDITFSSNKNEIISLYGGKEDDIGNRWFIGQPINGGGNSVYFDQKFTGIWQTEDSVLAASYSQKTGQIRVADLAGGADCKGAPDGKITDCDRIILGNTYPKWTGSLSTRLEWRQFDFSAMALTRQKYMVQNTFKTSNSTLAGRYNNLKVDYWLPNNPSNTAPRPNKAQESPIYGGTRAYEDASYVKIRNLTLGYTLPSNIVRRFGSGESIRLYATAQDPFMFTKFQGLDPEGRTSAGVPSYYSILIGATLGY